MKLKLNYKNLIYWLVVLVVTVIGVGPDLHQSHVNKAHEQTKTTITAKKGHDTKSRQKAAQPQSDHMRTPINWHKSSETVPYPNVSKLKHFWVKVSLSKNRTYLYDGNKLVYTMYSTGGMYKKNPHNGKMVSMTPTGTFHAQAERGDHFFNHQLNEGANYYVSWQDHGTYLFHSVPTKANGSYNVSEAKKLGKSTGSHGCIRLSIQDAQWMSKNLPVGTKVVIVN